MLFGVVFMRKKLSYILSGANISKPAKTLMRFSLILSCALLAASLLLAVYAGPLTAHSVTLHRLSADLYRAPQGVLLVAFLGALIVDSKMRGE